MDANEIRRRIEALNGSPLRNVPAGTSASCMASKRHNMRRTRGPIPDPPTSAGLDLPLTAALPGEEVQPDGAQTPFHLVHRDLIEVAPWTEPLAPMVMRAYQSPLLARRMRVTGLHVEDVLFIDIETLGLSPSEPLFLVGLLAMDPERGLVCDQLLARDLSEEASVLAGLSERLSAARLLVSFNGIGFDIPYIRTRAGALDVAMPAIPAHVDVLLDARPRFGRRLPNCRLVTLEKHVCGREREGDVPGSQVPAVYHAYLRTHDASGLANIARHNVLDLATTAELFGRFWAP